MVVKCELIWVISNYFHMYFLVAPSWVQWEICFGSVKDIRLNILWLISAESLLISQIWYGIVTGYPTWSSSQKISAQTWYVMDGIQEAVGELIVALKASSNRLLKMIEKSRDDLKPPLIVHDSFECRTDRLFMAQRMV